MNDEEKDEVNLLQPYKSDYAQLDPSSSPQRFKGIKRLNEAERLRLDVIQHINIDLLNYPHGIQRKHVNKKSLYKQEQIELSMSFSHGTSSPKYSGTDFDAERLRDKEWNLIPKLPGQTSEDIRYPTREVFEFVYSHFTENNSHKYLKEIQGWLHFVRQHKRMILHFLLQITQVSLIQIY